MALRKLPLWAGVGCFALGSLFNLCLYFAFVVAENPQPTEVAMAATVSNRSFKHAYEQPSAEIVQWSEKTITVPLEKDERALMLEATLDQDRTATFILDTGATYTSISKELAQELGYDLRQVPHVNITTANGQVSLPKVTLKSLTLNGYTAYNVEATVMNMPKNVPFSGLLGLSFVKRHRITIDSEAKHVVIEPRRG